jgi:rRNA pseudouridine-1189 N-methylase Emg1 (Nep1/Mra1 family)
VVNSSIESLSVYLGILFNSNARFAGGLDLPKLHVLINNTAGVLLGFVCMSRGALVEEWVPIRQSNKILGKFQLQAVFVCSKLLTHLLMFPV